MHADANTTTNLRLLWAAYHFKPADHESELSRDAAEEARRLSNFNGYFSGVWDGLLPELMRTCNLSTLVLLQTTSVVASQLADAAGAWFHVFPEVIRRASLKQEVFYDRGRRVCTPLQDRQAVVCNGTPLSDCSWEGL